MSRKLSNWLTSYLEFSYFSEAPDQFHYWTAISAVAGSLRRHVWIDMGYFQWTPNFYIVFVAPPGIVSKSTTANIGMNLLREVPGVHFGPDAVTWQSLVQSLGASAEGFEYDDELHTMSSISIVSSEFGTFLNPNDREMIDILVSLWDGQITTFKKATKTSGDDAIVNPWINLIACTTPAWIQGNFPEYMIGGGFTSRTIFVYSEEKRKLVAYPAKEIPEGHEALKRNLIHDLEHISTNVVGPYTLDASAERWGVDWYEALYEKNRESLSTDRFAGYVARKQTHLHKLAIVVAAAQSDRRTLSREHLIDAEAALVESERNQELVFSKIVSPDARPAMLVYDALRRAGRAVAKSEIYNELFGSVSNDQFEKGVEACQRAGRTTMYQRNGKMYVKLTESASGEGNPESENGGVLLPAPIPRDDAQ